MEDVEFGAPHGWAAQSRVAVVYIPTSIIPALGSAANQTTPALMVSAPGSAFEATVQK